MSITEAIQLLKAYKGPLGLTLHKPASEALISEVENLYGITLPADFKTFYRFTDGFETEEDMFNLIPLDEIIERKSWNADDPLCIAEYMIYCDMWQLEIDSDNNDEYVITVGDYEAGKITLTNSLGEFIRRFLSRGLFEIGGLYAWGDEIKAKLYGNTDPDKIKPLLWVFRECLKRGLMTKDDVVFRADWIIATEQKPHHFFIEMSNSRDLDELITVLTSINLTEDVIQVRAFFGYVYTKFSVNQITVDHVILILNNFSNDDRFTAYERNKMKGLIVDFDHVQSVKPMKQLKKRLDENIKDFIQEFMYFNLHHTKGWAKINDDLVKKFQSNRV